MTALLVFALVLGVLAWMLSTLPLVACPSCKAVIAPKTPRCTHCAVGLVWKGRKPKTAISPVQLVRPSRPPERRVDVPTRNGDSSVLANPFHPFSPLHPTNYSHGDPVPVDHDSSPCDSGSDSGGGYDGGGCDSGGGGGVD